MIGSNTIASKSDFTKKGYVKTQGLFTPDYISALRDICEETKSDSSFTSFAKNKYNVGIDHPSVKALIQDEKFRKFLLNMTDRDMIFTDGIVFELDHTRSGFDWHIGVTSFRYIFPEDYACTIWIPLDPVCTDAQNGGMSLLPKSIFSGLEFYKAQSAITSAVKAGLLNVDPAYCDIAGLRRLEGEAATTKKVRFDVARSVAPEAFSDSLYFSQFARSFLAQLSENFDYDIGDAMLFDKYVFHKSDGFRQGPMKSRRAFVMRFVDINARYNEVNARCMGGENSQIIEQIASGNGQPFALRDDLVLQRNEHSDPVTA